MQCFIVSGSVRFWIHMKQLQRLREKQIVILYLAEMQSQY